MARIKFMLAVVLSVLSFPVLSLRPAMADGQFTQLAKEGYWVAGSLASSATSPVSVCLAGEPHLSDLGFYLLVDHTGAPIIKITSASWSLTANFAGTIKIAVHGNNYALPITSNTADAMNAQLTPFQVLAIVADLKASTSMDLTVANLPLDTEPLDGSQDVLTAFMKCNEAMTSSNVPGGNPLSSMP